MIHKASFSRTKLTLLAVGSLSLSACIATAPTTTEPTPTNTPQNEVQSQPEKPTVVAEVGLTPRARMTKAIKNLERGNVDIALAELKEYSLAVPNSSRAANLIKQITVPSSEYYPEEYFTLKLRSGMSLSTIAKKYLGSAWEFYALAKYNQIDNPNRVNIGTDIKVPLTQLAKRVIAKEEAAANNKDAEALVETSSNEEDANAMPAHEADMEEPNLVVSDAPEMPSKESLTQQLLDANSVQNYAESIHIIESLKRFGPLTSDLQSASLVAMQARAKELVAEDPITAASLFVESGDIQLSNNAELAAFDSFKLASEADSSNASANEKMQALQKKITEKYHREASTAFRQQELDEAIAKWDIVLAVDPSHANASAYRTQAVELKCRLETLKGNNTNC
ncbi:LysM peptidoglycan-binding domain-containing protein [Agaribacter marinus]|uniref:LysM domain-containing protein n=1 Tax=Agaribacter marinus TaxID=1431249 RepID=A0AA37SXZ5_9ALTE|nr:LysM domain-containing protein [Agaribacter marinus]GLR71931.1 hypothetical protein GCM10007852_28390 [Agaribacter marinus]